MHLLDYLQIKMQEVRKDRVILTMNVEAFHKQPYGIVHGGINGVLIETACSLGANAQFSEENVYAVGVDLQINHLKSVANGTLTIIAKPDQIGGSLQVWEGKIFNADEELISVGRCTLLKRNRK
jgi:1,4-dihydroxy-2-naphthoyl-CoA hydrolase